MASLSESEVLERLGKVVKQVTKTEHRLTKDTHLIDSGILDSLDFIYYVFTVQDEFEFEIPEDDLEQHRLGNVGDMTDYLIAKVNNR